MKKIICVCAVLILILSVYTFAVSAASSEIIDKADIEMVVNTDGTVNVTEKWTVTYLNASDVFYRNIDIYSSGNGMTLLQKYDEIKERITMIRNKYFSAEELMPGVWQITNIFDSHANDKYEHCH